MKHFINNSNAELKTILSVLVFRHFQFIVVVKKKRKMIYI